MMIEIILFNYYLSFGH